MFLSVLGERSLTNFNSQRVLFFEDETTKPRMENNKTGERFRVKCDNLFAYTVLN